MLMLYGYHFIVQHPLSVHPNKMQFFKPQNNKKETERLQCHFVN